MRFNNRFYCTCKSKDGKIEEGHSKYRLVETYADGICEDCHHYAVEMNPLDINKRKVYASKRENRKSSSKTL